MTRFVESQLAFTLQCTDPKATFVHHVSAEKKNCANAQKCSMLSRSCLCEFFLSPDLKSVLKGTNFQSS
jgi:hypothetical protein